MSSYPRNTSPLSSSCFDAEAGLPQAYIISNISGKSVESVSIDQDTHALSSFDSDDSLEERFECFEDHSPAAAAAASPVDDKNPKNANSKEKVTLRLKDVSKKQPNMTDGGEHEEEEDNDIPRYFETCTAEDTFSLGNDILASNNNNNNDSCSCKTLKLLSSALELRRQHHGKSHPLVAAAWNDIGDYYATCENHSKAMIAYQLATMCDFDRETTRAYRNLAECSLSMENFDESIQFCNQALEMLQAMDTSEEDEKTIQRDIADAYHKMGIAFFHKKMLTEAIDYLHHATEVFSEIGESSEDVFLAKVYDSMGRIHSMHGDSQAALTEHVKALDIYFSSSSSSSDGGCCDRAATQCLDDIANICCKEKEYNRSIKALTKKMQLHSLFLDRCRQDPLKQYMISIEASAIVDTVVSLGKVQELRGYTIESNQCEREADFLYNAIVTYQDKCPVL